MIIFYAKSDNKTTIEQHTKDLLTHYKRFLYCYPAAFKYLDGRIMDAIKSAVIYHDLGKINTRFQSMLRKEGKLPDRLNDAYKKNKIDQMPHGALSLAFLDREKLKSEYGEYISKAIRLAVCYHHDRALLYDVDKYRELVFEIVEKDIALNVKEFQFDLLDSLIPDKRNIVSMPKINKLEEETWLVYAVVKGMLNRLDYAASSNLEKDTFEIPHNDGDMNLPRSICWRVKNEFETELNEVQKYMRENRDKSLIVKASTGIGKTEGALLWIGEDKGFYTLPLKVSINAIYDRIVKEYNYKNARLLHSDALTKYIGNSGEEYVDDPMKLYSQSRLFSSPLTICTVDQLFPFVFKHNGGEQLLATLAYSRIVIDEIQMYSGEIIAALIYGLKLIQKLGGKFAVITATMPVVVTNFMKEEGIDFEPPKTFFKDCQPRHYIKLIDEDLNIEEIRKAGADKKVLVIVNTVSKAQELYKELREDGAKLLHALFIKCHRKKLEEAIMNFSKADGENGIWITTQIVEASLDIDFDVLYTEMCTADSLLQRLGRCNRRGRVVPDSPNVFIYNTKNGRSVGGNRGIYDHVIYDESWDKIQKYDGKLFKESDKFDYVDAIYDENKNLKLKESFYYQTIVDRLNYLKSIEPFQNTKKEVREKFRDILSVSLIPDSIYKLISNKMDDWSRRLKDKNISNKEKAMIKNEIQDYTVNVSLGRRNDKRVDIGRQEIIYDYSGIHRSINEYDFDEKSLTGLGFQKNKFDPDNFD